MSAVEQIVAGDLLDAAQDRIAGRGAQWIQDLAAKGAQFIETLGDPAIKAGLRGALGTLTTPEAKDLLQKAAAHQVQGMAIRLGVGQRGEARAIFIGESDFAARHRLIKADNQALAQATDEHNAFVDALEKLLVDAAIKGGAAFVPFLLSVL